MEDEDVVAELRPIQVSSENFETLLMDLAILKEEIEKRSQILKSLKSEEDNMSYALAQYMMTRDIPFIGVGDKKFTQKQRVFSKVEDKEALRNWILENDAIDLVMAVHPSKLTAYCNEQLEAGGDTPSGVNPNFIKYYVHCK